MNIFEDIAGWKVDLLVEGFPGKSANGGLGWSSIVLLRGHGRTVLVDTGAFSIRPILIARLKELGIQAGDITDILLTHSHYDHMMNFTLFPQARIYLSRAEMDWALGQPVVGSLCLELYISALAASPQLTLIDPRDAIMPAITTLVMPGHTPHHVIFKIDDGEKRLLIAADAVKNRAEFLAERAMSTLDEAESSASIAKIKKLWEEREGAILLCGHDLPMRNDSGRATYLGERYAAITAWLDEDLSSPTVFRLKA